MRTPAPARLPIRGADRRPARVRPYSLTGGRTRLPRVLLVETFVATLDTEEKKSDRVPEMRAIVEVCRRMRTVAEIAALLKLPLGVVRVLVCDLADQGRLRVYGYGSGSGSGSGHGTGRPDRALLERVLSGLRRL
ncbi:DUF742 domain-containing protein [Streptomyces sp. NPDC090022]|uniref:DUF742 domain-containing protein n=1 Tax=Streptomyces sp. NPDC090022 TaxID=3365920 RepID=UPI0037FABE7E